MLHHMFTKEKINPDLAVFEKELCSFYEYCKTSGFTNEEMREICKPLIHMIRKAILFRILKYAAYLLTFVLIVYFLLKLEFVSWHLSAIGRILMIKILPYWNWEKLSNEKCLIPNFTILKPITSTNFDCTLCEAIDSIALETDIDPYQLSELYLDINVPVIVTDGLRNWPPVRDPSFNITDVILSDKKLSNSLPCELSTNMFSSLEYVDTIIHKSFKFKKWFFQFQNCDFIAVKQFRILSPRPYFLKPEISPVQYSWLLMSSNYNAPHYKKIDLREKITVFGQVKGSNLIKLIPRENCADDCPILETELQKGEVIVFSSLWDLEYKPNYQATNIAIILELH